jgi:two-component system, sensor histidine kinase and response regulator
MKKIMVVDDDPDQILSVRIILDSFSGEYEVMGASDGLKCLELLEQNQVPDLILLDIMMPKMNGWELYDKIKGNKSWTKIPIIFLTARTDNVARDAGRFLGDDYLEKPYDTEELKKRIDLAIKSVSTEIKTERA